MSYVLDVLNTRWLARGPRMALARGVRVHRGATVSCKYGGAVSLGEGTTVLPGAMILTYGGDIRLGRRCTVNPYVVLYGHGGLTIGDDVRIATHTVMIPNNHGFADPNIPIGQQPSLAKGIVIEDDVWIAANVTVLDGVTIGTGSVVGAGSVVTRSLEPRGVYAGSPARRLRSR